MAHTANKGFFLDQFFFDSFFFDSFNEKGKASQVIVVVAGRIWTVRSRACISLAKLSRRIV
jgi:hypothetical protein